jgi:hypothetical protein
MLSLFFGLAETSLVLSVREGEQFTALARRAPGADGVPWLTCGQVAFPARDPLLVGIASERGMVTHFDGVRVLTKP